MEEKLICPICRTEIDSSEQCSKCGTYGVKESEFNEQYEKIAFFAGVL